MVDISLLWSPAPYHILTYGTILGTEVHQSFISGVQAFRALPRPQFATLQAAIFPIYFSMQTAAPIILSLTYPGSRSEPAGLSGVIAPANRLSVLAPLSIMFVTSLMNLAFIGPATTKVMKERKHQETRDGKKSYDSPPHSKEMTNLNKQFAKLHGMSSLANMMGILATVWYGFTIADLIQ